MCGSDRPSMWAGDKRSIDGRLCAVETAKDVRQSRPASGPSGETRSLQATQPREYVAALELNLASRRSRGARQGTVQNRRTPELWPACPRQAS